VVADSLECISPPLTGCAGFDTTSYFISPENPISGVNDFCIEVVGDHTTGIFTDGGFWSIEWDGVSG
jgi:hypothetical protein